MLLDGVDAGTPKWHILMGGLIVRVHEAMNPSPNAKVHLRICSGNVNILKLTLKCLSVHNVDGMVNSADPDKTAPREVP